jgi:hypothetical protein
MQPMAGDEVANAVASVAAATPLNRILETAGSEQFRFDEFVRLGLAAATDPRKVVADPTPEPQIRELLKRARERQAPALDHLAEPMVLGMINEAAHLLEEGVAADGGAVDLAMVMGTGFPPFLGGPLRHADALGLPRIEPRLNALRAQRGERFRPAGLLSRLARDGGTLADFGMA